MKNALKIRLIHSMRYNAEAEYILEFFRFIGCLVYDESFDETKDADAWQNHLDLSNEKYGVDVVLNYSGVDNRKYSINGGERIYLYFSLEERTCEVLAKPLNEKCIKKYPSKKVTRQTALALLIGAIWNNDEANQTEIQKIREIYTPTNGEGDLFYILQEKSCFGIFQKALIPMAPYIKKMLEGLWKVYCMLEGNNPYIAYAKINAEMHLSELLNKIDRMEIKSREIQYNSQKLNIDRPVDMFLKLNLLAKDTPWFITMHFLKAYIYLEIAIRNGRPGLNLIIKFYRDIINQLSKKDFIPYYSDIFYRYGLCYLRYDPSAIEAINNFKKAAKLDPQNYEAIGRIISYHFMEGEAKAVESIENSMATDNKHFKLFSFRRLLGLYRVYSTMFKYSIAYEKEFSAKRYAKVCISICLNFYDAELVRKISDDEETDFQSLIEFHIKSPMIYALFTNVTTMGEITDQILTSQEFKFVKEKLAELEENQSN